MQRACKEGFLLELLVVRRDVFAQFNRPVGRLFLPLFFCVVVVDLSFRSIFHAYETRLSKGRPAHFTHSVVCSFPSFPSFFPLWCCAMRDAPCAAPPWWSDDDDWRLVPHGNGPWQWRHGRPWSMAAPSPFPPPPPVSPVSLFLSFLSCSFCLEGGSPAVAIAHTALCLAWLGGKPYQKQERRGDQCNGKPENILYKKK